MATARPSIVARIGAVADSEMTPLERVDRGQSDSDADQRVEQRQARRDHGAEGDREHEEGDQQAEGIRVLRRGLVDDAAAEGDGHTLGACRLGCRSEVPLRPGADSARRDLEGHRGVADATVLRDRRAAVGVGDEQHLRPSPGLGERCLDGHLDGGVVQGRAGRGGEDHLRSGARGGGEALLQQVHRLLRLGTRNRELRRLRLRDDDRDGGHCDQDHQPGEQGRPAMSKGTPTDLCQQSRHQFLRVRLGRRVPWDGGNRFSW